MKTKVLVYFLLSILVLATAKSQIIESSCLASDSIVNKYRVDASILTVRKFFENNLPYKDSIEIPAEHVDTVLNALIAVWNATELPARDTVVDMLKINAYPNYSVKQFRIRFDNTNNIIWINNLIEGDSISGNDTVDSLMNKYQLFLDGVSPPFLYLKTDSIYNMVTLSKLFEPIHGVVDVWTPMGDFYFMLRKDIFSEIRPDYVWLKYFYCWGIAPGDCSWIRNWEFRVYNDCSVEYIGSHGNVILWYNIFDVENDFASVSVYPNPFDNNIFIDGIEEPFDYSIYTIDGKKIIRNYTENNKIIIPENVKSGIYIFKVKTEKVVFTTKIIKN